MKKLLFLVILSVGFLSHAQYQRFVYEYRFAIDSTAKDKAETELMNLDIAPKGSKFYSNAYHEADSLMHAFMEKQIKSGNNNFSLKGFGYKGKLRYSVEKSYPDYAVNIINAIGNEEYLVQDSRVTQWKILSDKDKIGNFSVQKAVCDFVGRRWTAWFTTEVPIQDGPYKFHGLPGLIVKIEDQSHSHTFELKGIKKLDKAQEWVSGKDKKRYNPLINVDENKFKKVYTDYLQDPMRGLRQMLNSGKIVEMRDDNGKVIDTNKMLRDDEKRVKDNLKKENNILELDLLK